MPGSAYHKVAIKVAEWLSVVPECNINSSTKSVSDSLKNVQLNEDEELVSFDVTSLYTNVPVMEAINIAPRNSMICRTTKNHLLTEILSSNLRQ